MTNAVCTNKTNVETLVFIYFFLFINLRFAAILDEIAFASRICPSCGFFEFPLLLARIQQAGIIIVFVKLLIQGCNSSYMRRWCEINQQHAIIDANLTFSATTKKLISRCKTLQWKINFNL